MTATAGFDVPQRRLQPADAPSAARPDVVVRLHRVPHPAPADFDQLARAVHAVVEALAPGLHAEVSVVDASQPDDSPLPGTVSSGPVSSGPVSSGPVSSGPVSSGPASSDVVGDEHIRLDRRSRTLTVDGELVSLTRREFELLAHLAQHQGLALSRRELMNAVWHERYLPGDRTVDVHVRRVRVKLGAHADRLSTLRGFGYRFG